MTTSNYMPDVRVEIAFNAGYGTAAASRTWTDVSAYVELEQVINIKRGRPDEFGEISPSELKLTLMNSDGRFTPGLSTGAYYPNVKIGRPIRVTSTPVGGAASTRFVGYIDEWSVEWDAYEKQAYTRISAYSRRARLGFGNERRSVVEEEFLYDDPIAYYTLGDEEGATTAGESSGYGAAPLTVAGSGDPVVFGAATGPPTDGLTAATFAGGQFLRSSGGFTIPTGGASFTLEAFFSTSSVSGTFRPFVAVRGSTSTDFVFLELRSDHTLGARGGGFLPDMASVATVNDGATHHAAVTVSVSAGTATTKLYLDGALVDTDTQAATTAGLGHLEVGGIAEDLFDYVGAVAHVAVYNSALSATRIAAHAAAGAGGFAGDSSDEWIARLAAWEGIPTAEQSLEVGTATIAVLDTNGQTAIDAMETVAATESGVLYDGRDGALTFHNRSHRYNAVSSFTLSMASQQVETDYAPTLDRQSLINDVTAANADGSAFARAVDTDSRDNYGVARSQVELVGDSADGPTDAANWLVNTYSEPRTRVPTLSVQLLVLDLTLQTSLLAADISTRFTVSGAPANAPATTPSYIVEGYDEQIGPESYALTFNVSDATLLDVFELDDAILGVLDDDRLAL